MLVQRGRPRGGCPVSAVTVSDVLEWGRRSRRSSHFLNTWQAAITYTVALNSCYGGALLDGFEEWLAIYEGVDRSALWWGTVVRRIALPARYPSMDLSEAEGVEVYDMIFSLVIEFVHSKDRDFLLPQPTLPTRLE